MSAAPVRCILSKSELDSDLDIRGGGGERGNGHPDPNIRAGGQTSKNFFQPFGPQFGLKIRGGPSPGSDTESDRLMEVKTIKNNLKN